MTMLFMKKYDELRQKLASKGLLMNDYIETLSKEDAAILKQIRDVRNELAFNAAYKNTHEAEMETWIAFLGKLIAEII